MWVRKKEIQKLSDDIRRIIDGQDIDIRDNREGVIGALKNDIHTLAGLKNEQVSALLRDRDAMAENLISISHQLKTPLTSMLIMADLLDDMLGAGNDSAIGSDSKDATNKPAEFLSNIKTSLTRMDWLVSALLKMAKLDAGAVEFSPVHVQAEELVKTALEPLMILLDVKDQRVDMSNGSRSETIDTEIFCDKRWTAEALTNVLKNASEYSPPGSVIKAQSGENPICSWICVTDSGTGISRADMARLFKRFEGSRSDSGYGVGLPLAMAIMRGQNGDIEVSSSTSGTTFTLKFYNHPAP